jgi:peptide deformylase
MGIPHNGWIYMLTSSTSSDESTPYNYGDLPIRIVSPDHSHLMFKASPVTQQDLDNPRFQLIIDQILRFMDEKRIWALAGPEVGLLKQVIFVGYAIDYPEIKTTFVDPRCYINPVVSVLQNEGRLIREDCLTMGPYVAQVYRPSHIYVKAINSAGIQVEFIPSPERAALIMHSMDHLEAIRLVDKPSAEVVCFSNNYEKEAFLEGKDIQYLHPHYPTDQEVRKKIYKT